MAGRRKNAAGDTDAPAGETATRLDKWLFYARFFKTRSLAAEVVSKGRLRLNGQRTSKPGHSVRPGDVLTFPMGRLVRVIRVTAITDNRGPATDAQTLYFDLDPPKIALDGVDCDDLNS